MRPGEVLGIAWLFLSGCFLLPSGEASRVEDVPSEWRRASEWVAPPVGDRHPYGDAGQIEVGRWARYREEGREITLAVVGREEAGTWVEVIEEGKPRAVSARLVTPEGIVRRAWYAEVPPGRRPVPVPQEVQSWSLPRRWAEEVSREVGEERWKVAGRELTVRRIRILREDAEGRLVEEVTLWHPEVPPLYEGSDQGGLVLRRVGSRVVAELVDFGRGARPVLEIPR